MVNITDLDNSKLIRKKELKNGIVSYNFTRKAFFKSEWNDLTITARGLFIDNETGKIIARSYNKFFNLGEQTTTTEEELKKNLSFPIVGYRKENGFLGIVSYNPKDNDLFIASKSTDEGDFKNYLKTILLNTLSKDKQEELKIYCKENNVSFIFECIDIINDPHIIEYDKSRVVLLDIIHNDFENTFYPYEKLREVATHFNLIVKSKEFTFNNFNELKNFFNEQLSSMDNEIEGYVFVDKNQFMFKFKTLYYRFWKQMRKIKEFLCSGKDVNTEDMSEREIKVLNFMNTFNIDELKNISIIDVRNKYLGVK